MKKIISIMLVALLVLTLFVGCNVSTGLNKDVTLTITNGDEKITLDKQGIEKLEVKEIETTSVSSKGDVSEAKLKVFSVTKLIKDNKIDYDKITSVDFVASDGYIMNTPRADFEADDIYVILEFNGDKLETPRSCIPNKRAMYWVRDLVEVRLNFDDVVAGGNQGSDSSFTGGSVKNVVLFQEGISGIEGKKLNNRGYDVMSYSLKTFDEKYLSLSKNPIQMTAKDGFSKTETADVFYSNFVTLEAEKGEEEDLPLYFSETISDGMRVKTLNTTVAGENAVYYGSEIKASDLFEEIGMADVTEYTLVASDGFSVTVKKEFITHMKIYFDAEKKCMRSSFEGVDTSEIKGGGKMKYLLNIKATGEANVESVGSEKDALLKFTVNGKENFLSQAEFEKLAMVTKDLTRTNSKGFTTSGTYKGVQWKSFAEKFGFDSNKSARVVASDGYETIISAEMLNDADSLFAIYENGEPIKSDGNGKTWFCVSNKYTANFWAKYVFEIVVE